MGCMPYGLGCTILGLDEMEFQSLIWVACPTGHGIACRNAAGAVVSIPHMGCMPYGLIALTGCQLVA